MTAYCAFALVVAAATAASADFPSTCTFYPSVGTSSLGSFRGAACVMTELTTAGDGVDVDASF